MDLAQSTATLVVNRDNHTLVATGGLWGPTIRHHKSTFYITCTNICWVDGEAKYNNFVIQTSDIWSNTWSNPVFFDFHGIDPNLFFDDDDRVYLQGSRVIDYSKQPSTSIDQFEIDVTTGEKLSEQKTIWGGFLQVDAEGPRIYKRGKWYYLVIAEGGTFEHHVVTAARSKNIWGPYESSDMNPLLPAAVEGAYIQQTGHPDIFQDTRGEWWATVLGTRTQDGRFPMGRETFLVKVSWPTENDWPILSPVELEIPGPKLDIPPSEQKDVALSMQKSFVHIRNGPLNQYRISDNGHSIHLLANQADLPGLPEVPAFVGIRQRKLTGMADVHLHVDDQLRGQQFQAGLTLYKDENRFLDVHYDSPSSSIVHRVHNKVNNLNQSTRYGITLGTSPLQFRMRYTHAEYEFFYRVNDEAEWVSVGLIDSKDISGFDFTGPMIGVFATSPKPNLEVSFSNFGVDGDTV